MDILGNMLGFGSSGKERYNDAEKNLGKEELAELRNHLNSSSKSERKEALKRTIVMMTVGKDVSSLFTDVLKCIQTPNIEIKKLVYLYVINYADVNPDLTLLAVNAFTKDSADPNPILRALALRSMSSLRVEKLMVYICEPLHRAFKDTSPYVRKTAVVCVAKLHKVDPQLVEEEGFLTALQDSLNDSNPFVVTNAIMALRDIYGKVPIQLNQLPRLIQIIDETSEWAQIAILETLAGSLELQTEEDGLALIEVCTARLNHINPAVVLAAVRLIVKCTQVIRSPDHLNRVLKKLTPSMISLLNSAPEMQYISLRLFRGLIQQYPGFLHSEFRSFFCNYTDMRCVKIEKVAIMVKLVNDNSVNQVLTELKENCNDCDVEFVDKVIQGIGQIALKTGKYADLCVDTLLELLKSDIPHVTENVVLVVATLLRVHQGRYDHHTPLLTQHFDIVNSPAPRSALVWLLGTFVSHIENAPDLFAELASSWYEETADIQLMLIITGLRIYLHTGAGKDALAHMLQSIITKADNPDIHDIAVMHMRALGTDRQALNAVINCEKPTMAYTDGDLNQEQMKNVFENLGDLSSIFYIDPSYLISTVQLSAAAESFVKPEKVHDEERLLDLLDDSTPVAPTVASTSSRSSGGTGGIDLESLLSIEPKSSAISGASGMPGVYSPQPPASAPIVVGFEDLFSGISVTSSKPSTYSVSKPIVSGDNSLLSDLFGGPAPASRTPLSPCSTSSSTKTAAAGGSDGMQLLLPINKANGLEIHGCISRGTSDPSSLVFELDIVNKSCPSAVSDIVVAVNKNILGLKSGGALQWQGGMSTIGPGKRARASCSLILGGDVVDTAGTTSEGNPFLLQIALKSTPVGILYAGYDLTRSIFALLVPVGAGGMGGGKVNKSDFLHHWSSVPQSMESSFEFQPKQLASSRPGGAMDITSVASYLESKYIYFVASRGNLYYFSSRTLYSSLDQYVLLELDLVNRKVCLRVVPVRSNLPGGSSGVVKSVHTFTMLAMRNGLDSL